MTSTSGLAARAARGAVIGLLAGGLAAACGTGSSAQSGETSSSPASRASAPTPLTSQQLCAKLSPTNLQQITGTAWNPGAPPPGPAQPDIASCTVGGKNTLSVVVHNTNGGAAVQNSLRAHLLPYQPVSGVGDQAAYASLAAGTGSTDSLVVTSGDRSYLFTLVRPDTPSGQGLEPLKKIMALVTG
jgi:hypothetical protein